MANRIAPLILAGLIWSLVLASSSCKRDSYINCMEEASDELYEHINSIDHIMSCMLDSYQLEDNIHFTYKMLSTATDEIESVLSEIQIKMVRPDGEYPVVEEVFTAYDDIVRKLQSDLSDIHEIVRQHHNDDLEIEDQRWEKYSRVGDYLKGYSSTLSQLNGTVSSINSCLLDGNSSSIEDSSLAELCEQIENNTDAMNKAIKEISFQCQAPVTDFTVETNNLITALTGYSNQYLVGLLQYANFYNQTMTKNNCIIIPPASFQMPEPSHAGFSNSRFFGKRSFGDGVEMTLEDPMSEEELETENMCLDTIYKSNLVKPHSFGCYSIKDIEKEVSFGEEFIKSLEATLAEFLSYFTPQEFPDTSLLRKPEITEFISGMTEALNRTSLVGFNTYLIFCDYSFGEFCEKISTCSGQTRELHPEKPDEETMYIFV